MTNSNLKNLLNRKGIYKQNLVSRVKEQECEPLIHCNKMVRLDLPGLNKKEEAYSKNN